MILSESSIKSMIDAGSIVIDPDPRDDQFQPASLDLRIGDSLFDKAHDEEVDELVLEPWRPYLGFTLDRIELPNDVAAFMTGRSSVGRGFVVVHKTAGWIDPGFRGQLRLEMFNFGMTRFELEPGQRVAQLVFIPTDKPTDGYDGQYQDQEGPKPIDNDM